MLLAGGIVCIVGAAFFARALPRLRAQALPTYIERGIIVPESARGLGNATALRMAIAQKHGLEPERLFFGCGTDEIFGLICAAYLEPGVSNPDPKPSSAMYFCTSTSPP